MVKMEHVLPSPTAAVVGVPCFKVKNKEMQGEEVEPKKKEEADMCFCEPM